MSIDKCIHCDAPLVGHCREYFDGEGNFVGLVHAECFQLMTAPRTYEQGRADGRKEMAEAACKAQCRWCAGRVTYDNGWHSDTVIHLRCESELIRRAAKELGVEL